LHLQPVFPYFLQNSLSMSGQQERRAAIEANTSHLSPKG